MNRYKETTLGASRDYGWSDRTSHRSRERLPRSGYPSGFGRLLRSNHRGKKPLKAQTLKALPGQMGLPKNVTDFIELNINLLREQYAESVTTLIEDLEAIRDSESLTTKCLPAFMAKDAVEVVSAAVTSYVEGTFEEGISLCFRGWNVHVNKDIDATLVPVVKGAIGLALRAHKITVDDDCMFVKFDDDEAREVVERRVLPKELAKKIKQIRGLVLGKEKLINERDAVLKRRRQKAKKAGAKLEAAKKDLADLRQREGYLTRVLAERMRDRKESAAKRVKTEDRGAPATEPGEAMPPLEAPPVVQATQAAEPNPATPGGTGPGCPEQAAVNREGEIQTRA